MQIARFRIGSGRDNAREIPASEVPEALRFPSYAARRAARTRTDPRSRAWWRRPGRAGGARRRVFVGAGTRGPRYRVHDRPKYFGPAATPEAKPARAAADGKAKAKDGEAAAARRARAAAEPAAEPAPAV